MKFKKVEIQAFRAYQSIEDGTFDFEIIKESEKAIADFISIYAPNGFGKTSFYDAVEYGVTNSIDRFLKNPQPKDIASNERKISKNRRGQWILRNRYVQDENIHSEVNLYTTTSTRPIKRQVPSNSRSSSSDFHFDKKKIQNDYFQTVILSQEWIDAFLKVDNPKERYDKFMNYFGDKETAEYYKKVVKLISLGNDKIKELDKLLSGKQLKLDFSGDKEILTKVNNKIQELNKAGEKIKYINESYSKEESVELSTSVSERLNELDNEKIGLDRILGYIIEVFAGSDSIKSIESYYISKNQLSNYNQRALEINEINKKFKEKTSLVTQVENLNKQQQEVFKKDEVIIELKKSFPLYEEIVEKIKLNESEIASGQKNSNHLQEDIKNVQLDASNIKAQLSLEQKQKLSYTEQLQNTTEQNNKVTNNNVRLIKVIREIDDTVKNIESLAKKKKFIDSDITTFETSFENLNNNLFPSAYEKEFIDHQELIQNIELIQTELNNKKKELESLNAKVKEQELFIKDIEIFIAKGSEITNQVQSSTCPLCNHEYDSFSELSSKISNNKYLSEELSHSLSQRATIETQIKDKSKELEEKIKALQKIIVETLSQKRKTSKELQNDINVKNDSLKSLNDEHIVLKNEVEKLNSFLSGVSFDEYQTKTEAILVKLDKSIKEKNDIVEKKQERLGQLFVSKEKIDAKLNVLSKTASEIKENEHYKSVIAFFNSEFPNEEINIKKIDKVSDELMNEANSIHASKKEKNDRLKGLNDELQNSSQELVQNEYDKLIVKLEDLKIIIVSFEQFLKDKFNLSVDKLNENELKIELESKKKDSLKAIKKIEQKSFDFKLLKDIKKDVEPYLEYQKAQKEATDLKSEKSLYKNKVLPLLEQEKSKISEYLKNQVSSFFYEELINDLYKRIDPHPDYRKISFVCDFTENSPKLNVCLFRGEDDDNPIIPNLYFSTAQLNILSLSIFLAKALNAKDKEGNSVNCIFIDDPIQSMDSINILSTIDLFRSIVVNQEKQIILSTHDENFHNLLKKKMPSGLFKSKFMELETFGKVKPD